MSDGIRPWCCRGIGLIVIGLGALAACVPASSATRPAQRPVPSISAPSPPALGASSPAPEFVDPASLLPSTTAVFAPAAVAFATPEEAIEVDQAIGPCRDQVPLPTSNCYSWAADVPEGTIYAVHIVDGSGGFLVLVTEQADGFAVVDTTGDDGYDQPAWARLPTSPDDGLFYTAWHAINTRTSRYSVSFVGACPDPLSGNPKYTCGIMIVTGPTTVDVQVLDGTGAMYERWVAQYRPDADRYELYPFESGGEAPPLEAPSATVGPTNPAPPPAAAPTAAPVVAAVLASVTWDGTYVDEPATEPLHIGHHGRRVAALQAELVARGFLDDVADGYFGPRTESAVTEVQRRLGLVVDGRAGPEVLAGLGL